VGAAPSQKHEHKRADPRACSYHHSRFPSSLVCGQPRSFGSIEYIQV
jgi:hypothetical protein